MPHKNFQRLHKITYMVHVFVAHTRVVGEQATKPWQKQHLGGIPEPHSHRGTPREHRATPRATKEPCQWDFGSGQDTTQKHLQHRSLFYLQRQLHDFILNPSTAKVFSTGHSPLHSLSRQCREYSQQWLGLPRYILQCNTINPTTIPVGIDLKLHFINCS